MAKTTAYLVDSSIYIFRAWFTLPDSLTNDNGDPVNAVYGFIDFVAGFLEETRPTHLSFAFDQSLTSSFRNTIYPPYKANRDPAPDELKLQFEYCRRFIQAIGFPLLSSDRYEADDLLGTAAARARADGHNVTILSADKDLAQLIEEGDTLWDYARDRRFNPKKVKEHFGVRPDQIADQLALAGDKVDNIPGVPGVGMTTAARLLTKFETIDGLLKNIPAISDMGIRGAKRIQGLIEEHQEMILLCKKLTEIKCDVETLHGDYELERGQCDYSDLDELFNEIGIGNIRREKWKKLVVN
ncbi:MAG: 5'-3' exonuclease H3TH domain-containing protein [Gammaproteobacteria bacterium]|nr:5'-3' exonuclease H3TH domain-containing protein [Gammaproteobacteria bacterium]